MQTVDPIVAQASPNIYAAAKNANLSNQSVNQVEQMSYALDQHKKLMAMDTNLGHDAYAKLDPQIQEGLKFMFKNAPYMQGPASEGQKIMGALKWTGTALASPIIGIFKAAGAYNRAINTPYLVAREVAQGDGSVFNAKIWKAAWDGNSVYDNGALDKAVQIYGSSDVEVAKGLLAGKTPGEIVQAHGKVDQGILESIQKAYNKPNDFRPTLDYVKYAQVSPGRDITRMTDDKIVTNGGVHGDLINGTRKNVSGLFDAIYQIVIDPLTWLTGGGDKAATIGERLAQTIKDSAETHGGLPVGVAKAFEEPRVYSLWQDVLGPAIKDFSEAKTTAEKSSVYRQVVYNVPGYANRDVFQRLAKAKVYDAKSAQEYFSQAENVHLMLAGRVEGVTYARNGVAVAKAHRNYTDGIMSFMDSVFNPTTSKTLGALKTTGRDVETLQAKGEEIYNAAIKTGDTLDKLAGQSKGLVDTIKTATGEISRLKRFGYWMGQQASRSPAGAEIKIGRDASQTASNFTAAARQLMPRDFADFMTQKFLDATPDEQVIIVRNLYAGIMYKFGLHGEPSGKALMNEILQTKFGTTGGFATMVDTAVPDVLAPHLEATSVKNLAGVPTLEGEHSIQPYHSAYRIGALPYDKISEAVLDMKSKRNLLNAAMGAANGPFSKKLVDMWSLLTLLPRLGIRSTIDEAMMFLMTAPAKDILGYARREGTRMGRMSTAFTGSPEASGPLRAGIQKMFRRNALHEAVPFEKRQQLLEDYAKAHGIEDPTLLRDLQKREAIFQYVDSIYGKRLNAESRGYLFQGLVHHPDMLNALAESLVGRSGLSGKIEPELHKAMIDVSNLTKALEEFSLKTGGATYSVSTKDLQNISESHLALAHFDKWVRAFAGNKVKLTERRILNPVHVFFSNKALETTEDAEKAMDQLSMAVGLEKTSTGWIVKDQAAIDELKGMSARSFELSARGVDDATIARDQIGRMLTDMYTTFHGSHEGYNEQLFNAVKNIHAKQVRDSKDLIKPSWNDAAGGVDFNNFMNWTTKHRPQGVINTGIEFPGLKEPETLFRKYGNTWMSWMDRQINSIYRQPALMVTYTELRKSYAPIERQFAADTYKAMVKADPERYASPKAAQILNDQVRALAEKRFTEIGMQEAANTILKYADNPAVRSNFSYGVRTVGRYYRATEDFQRRIYRLKEVPLRVLYRMRLAHLGLAASGSVFTDAQNNEYVNIPMDNILFKATDTTLRALTGKDVGYHQPMFNNLTMKLNMINPSFQQDAGLPMLSGPIAGLSVVAMKNLLGYSHNPDLIKAGNAASTIGLGNFGTNTNLQKALMPTSLQRAWDMLPMNEKSRQEVTAGMQALAYNAANGVSPLTANSTDKEKAAYLKNVRVSAHNIIFLRNLLGFISPATPTLVESQGVPDYLQRVGVTGLRTEFFDLLNAITAKTNGDVQDPYELALVTFMGKYPGKLIYTVSRDSKATRVIVKNTQALNNWAVDNNGLISTYGEVAYIFAPQVGQYNASSFNYLQAAGLVTSKSLETYYNDLLVAQDKQAYYDIATNEKAAILATSSISQRQQIIAEATAARDGLIQSNPLLQSAIIGQGNNIGTETKLLSNLDQLVNDPSANIPPATRTRMALAIKMIKDFMAFAQDPALKSLSNATELKAERRQQIEANLTDLMNGDLAVAEADRAIFKSILKSLSRDTYVAVKQAF